MPIMNIEQQTNPEKDIPNYIENRNETDIFKLAYINQLPILIKGPTGCGKTRFVEHMASILQRPLYTVSCHDDLSASDLVGRHLIGSDGTYWMDGPLTRAVRNGGICYLDEIVEARKDTTVILHSLSDNRRILPIDRTGETLQAPAEFMLVVSYNPGYQNLFKGLKPSTRQRFISLSFGFPDAKREIDIIIHESNIGIETATRLVTLANALRSTSEHDIDEAPGTRLLVDAAKLVASGCNEIDACRYAVVECLSDDTDINNAFMQVVFAVFGDK